MNTLTSITGGLTSNLLPAVMSAVLSVLGLLTALVFAVWGALHVYAILSGESSSSVAYKIGRIFGDLVYAEGYENYKSKQRQRERNDSYQDRYFDELYDSGKARKGRDFY